MKVLKRTALIISIVFLSLTFLLVAINLFFNFRCYNFYSNSKKAGEIAGLSDGLVQQGLDYVEESDTLLTAGYMNNSKMASRIYATTDGKTTCTELYEDEDTVYTGHCGGITHYGEYLFVGATNALKVFNLSDILDGKEKAILKDTINLPHNASWCTIHGEYLYAGLFILDNDKKYGTHSTSLDVTFNTCDGENVGGVISVYKLDSEKEYGIDTAPAPEYFISTPQAVQGGYFRADGQLVLSASYGLSISKFYFYDISSLIGTPDGEFVVDGESVPLYHLDSRTLTCTVAAPPMAEEIVIVNDYMYVNNESASAKYKFGNLIGGRQLYAYKVSDGHFEK